MISSLTQAEFLYTIPKKCSLLGFGLVCGMNPIIIAC